MVYWLLLAVLLLMTGISKKNIRYGNRNYALVAGKKVYIAIACIMFVLLAGLRNTQVGMDTEMYSVLFRYMQNMRSFKQALNSWQLGGVEPGYALTEYLFSRHLSFQVFLFAMGMISIVPIMVVIYKYSKNYWMSLFLFVAFGYFSFAMNGIRQAVAIGICMIAYIFAKEKKLVPYLFSVAFAMTFHLSAAIFIPVYWLSNIKLNKRTVLIYLVALAVTNIFKNQLFTIANVFGRQVYSSTGDAGGVRMYLFMMATVAVIYFFRHDFIKESPEDNTTLLSMFAIATLIWPIASANAAMFRLYYYYHVFMVFCIPAFLHSQKRNVRFLFTVIFILVSVYYLQVYIIGGNLKYNPYYFFWQ